MKAAIRIFLYLLLGISTSLYSQVQKRNQSFFLEVGGSGGLGSFNYERGLLQKEKISLLGRVGISAAPIDWRNNGMAIVFPFMIHSTIGNRKLKPDFGIGQSLTITTKGKYFALMPVSAGLRFQKENKPIWFRFSYTPLISYIYDLQIQHWAGISIGLKLGIK